MAKSYSIDLREKVLQYLDKNQDKHEASRIFQVGIASIYRWVALKKITGSLKPKRRPYAYKKLDDQKLIEYVQSNPDLFLSEIASHFNVTAQAIFYAMKRLKITRKKRVYSMKKGMVKRGKSF